MGAQNVTMTTCEWQPPGPGGTAIIWANMCRCEGYGFQAVYSRIGYINQNISVWDRVSFFQETDQLVEDFI